jgi:hypothetical protein
MKNLKLFSISKKLTLSQLADGEGPEYILLNKNNGVYKTWATAEKFPELIKTLLSQVPENFRIKLAEEILNSK